MIWEVEFSKILELSKVLIHKFEYLLSAQSISYLYGHDKKNQSYELNWSKMRILPVNHVNEGR